MNINHNLKCILIHIPKTGGNSIKRLLNIRGHAHKPVSFHDDKLLSDYFTFGFTRNPWDRFVSAYCYLANGGMSKFDVKIRKRYLDKYNSFEDFVLNSDYTSLTQQIHFRPQVYYLDKEIDFVGKCENMVEDMKSVCENIGIPNRELVRMNESKHENYIQCYRDKTKRIIEEIYKEDIERFGYTFGE